MTPRTTEQLKADIEKCFETYSCPCDEEDGTFVHKEGHNWEEIYCCQGCMMSSLLALIERERKAAVFEAVPIVMREVLELPCINFVGDAKNDSAFAKDCCERIIAKLFPPLPEDSKHESIM